MAPGSDLATRNMLHARAVSQAVFSGEARSVGHPVAPQRVPTRAPAFLWIIATLSLLGSAVAVAQPVKENLWSTDGTVRAVVVSAGTIYIGGDFIRVGPVSGSGVPLHAVRRPHGIRVSAPDPPCRRSCSTARRSTGAHATHREGDATALTRPRGGRRRSSRRRQSRERRGQRALVSHSVRAARHAPSIASALHLPFRTRSRTRAARALR
jgi:hypothetical protein